MELKPVEKIDPPSYPADEEFADAKGMLSENIPCRWRKVKGLAGAVAVAIMANLSGGCGSETANNGNPNIGISQATTIEPPEAQDNLIVDAGDWTKSIFNDNSSSQSIFMGSYVTVPRTLHLEDNARQILLDGIDKLQGKKIKSAQGRE
jgi:hypothetical protein